MFWLSALLLLAPLDAFQILPGPRHHSAAVVAAAIKRTPCFYADNNNYVSDNDWSYPPEFHRAVECAKHQGLCDVDELLQLADELEAYDGCLMVDRGEQEAEFKGGDEEEGDDCEKESLDRLDIADLLRTEGEMMQRRDTIEFSNLFKEKVEQQRGNNQAAKEAVIDLYSNYYQCIYSRTSGP